MDNLKLEIKNLFGKVKSKKGIYVKKLINPTHDWNVFLFTIIIILTIGFLFVWYIYGKINSGMLFPEPVENISERMVRIDKALLDKSIEEIKNKEILREKIGDSVSKDPSI